MDDVDRHLYSWQNVYSIPITFPTFFAKIHFPKKNIHIKLSAKKAKVNKKSKVIHQIVWSFLETDLIDWLPSTIVCVLNC